MLLANNEYLFAFKYEYGRNKLRSDQIMSLEKQIEKNTFRSRREHVKFFSFTVQGSQEFFFTATHEQS